MNRERVLLKDKVVKKLLNSENPTCREYLVRLIDKHGFDILRTNENKSYSSNEKERILSINPTANVETFAEFFMPGNSEILNNSITYIVDAIDTVTAKIELVMQAEKLNVPIISSMGTGNKLNPRFV